MGGLLLLFTQAVSFHPRVFVAGFNCVPPTDVTNGDAEGYCTPPWYAPSPEEKVMSTPG